MQVLGSVPNAEWCEFPIDPPAWTVEARDAMLAEPTAIDPDGFVTMPETPGLGIKLDEERIAAHGEEIP